jgi:hypothetical protein
MIDKEEVRQKVAESFAWMLDLHGLDEVIDDTELTEEEAKWAHENLCWSIAIRVVDEP